MFYFDQNYIFHMSKIINTILLVASIALLSACDSESKFQDLEQAIKRNKLNISSIVVEPTKNRTIAINGTPCDPCDATFLPTGKTESFVARGLTADGQPIDISQDVVWSTSNSNVALVDQSGRLTTQTTVGNVDVIASFASIEGRAAVTVSSAVLTENNIIFRNNGQDISATTPDVTMCDTYELSMVGDFGDSQRIITHDIKWDITVASVATLAAKVVRNDATNIAVFSSYTPTPQAPNPAAPYEVKASYQNNSTSIVSRILNVNVVPDIFGTSISVTPTSQPITKDTTFQFRATGSINSVSKDLTSTAKWVTSDSNVAKVTDGLVTGIAKGSANITASCGTVVSQAALVTVEEDPTLVAIKIKDTNEDTITLLELTLSSTTDNEKDLIVMATYTNLSEGDVTADVTWEITAFDGNNADPPISVALTSDDKLRVTAKRLGDAVLKVKLSGKEDTLSVRVR